jgi:hypothetical protein
MAQLCCLATFLSRLGVQATKQAVVQHNKKMVTAKACHRVGCRMKWNHNQRLIPTQKKHIACVLPCNKNIHFYHKILLLNSYFFFSFYSCIPSPPKATWVVKVSWTNEPIHSFLVEYLNFGLRETNVQVGSPHPRGSLGHVPSPWWATKITTWIQSYGEVCIMGFIPIVTIL